MQSFERTKQSMLSFSSDVIDNKIIYSMPKRINMERAKE